MRSYLACFAGILIVISLSACRRESAEYRQKEAERTQRLAPELSKAVESISEENKKIRDELEKPHANLAEEVPDYQTYHEQLINGLSEIDQLAGLINTKRYPEIPAPAFNGFKKSSLLGMQFFVKAKEQFEASVKLIDAKKYSEVNQSNNKAKYYQALAGIAAVQEGVFFGIYKTLLFNSSAAERANLFEQAAMAYSSIERPGAELALRNALRQAYKEENNAENHTRMEQWLKQYKIPEASETPTPVPAK